MQTTTVRVVGQGRGFGDRIADVAGWIVLIVMTFAFLLPFYLLLRNALATRKDVTAVPWTLWPSEPQWQNFTDLFTSSEIPMASSMIELGHHRGLHHHRHPARLLDGRLRPGPDPEPVRTADLLHGAGHVDDSRRRHVRAQLHHRLRTGLGVRLPRHHHPRTVQRIHRVLVPAVLPGVP